jgi:hypothetical protein
LSCIRFGLVGPPILDGSAPRVATAATRLERAFRSTLEAYYKLKRGNTQQSRSGRLYWHSPQLNRTRPLCGRARPISLFTRMPSFL